METRITRLLDWTQRDKAWFLCIVTVPLYLFYGAWAWLSLRYTEFGRQFLDPDMTHLACTYALYASGVWLLGVLWGSVLRHRGRESDVYVTSVILAYGPGQLPLAYLSGLAEPMTGVILLGATITGFVLFSYWRVLLAFFLSLAVLVILSVLSVEGVLIYAPMLVADPISRDYVSPYYVASQFVLGIPFVTAAFIICYMLLSRWRRREAQSQRMAVTDALTGVANRRAVSEALHHEYLRARRHDQWLAVIMVDLDFFKQINDRYGHDAGDRVLVESARQLLGCVREIDLVGRMGGEEFVLVLPDTDEAEALQVAERCRQAISQLRVMLASDQVLSVTASLGVCALRAGSVQDAERLMVLADQALYRAKEAGRDRVLPYRDAMSE